ncbi:hypothetical protein [Pulveribacter sp.]|uniref:hypothetical protein n=1 Tax=Pulveribacter sp. TaxID=2678893 RepID=UPI0028AFBD77|nr:hypothetical protein [Pulveribacter sp.]
MSLKNDMAQVMAILDERNARESELLAATGWSAKKLVRVLAALHQRVMALPYRPGTTDETCWMGAAKVIARCPWDRAQVLLALATHEHGTRELASMAGCAEAPMRTLLRRMEHEKRIKLVAFNGLRKWVLASRPSGTPGGWVKVSDDDLLALIAEHQPVKLMQLVEMTGRGRLFIRSRVGHLRQQGLVRHDVVGDSWRYSLASRQRTAQEVEQAILLRCQDVGGDCLKWDGAHSRQGHALMRHDDNIRRVDLVLWTVVHGKPLPDGHTLARTCETPGCCNHAHHRQVTRREAMKIAFDALGRPWREAHGLRLSAAMRGKVGVLTPERLELVRTSKESSTALAKQFDCATDVVASARRGDSYRDSARLAHPFAGLLERAAA